MCIDTDVNMDFTVIPSKIIYIENNNSQLSIPSDVTVVSTAIQGGLAPPYGIILFLLSVAYRVFREGGMGKSYQFVSWQAKKHTTTTYLFILRSNRAGYLIFDKQKKKSYPTPSPRHGVGGGGGMGVCWGRGGWCQLCLDLTSTHLTSKKKNCVLQRL